MALGSGSRIDHIALEVSDFDERVRTMTEHLGLVCRRIGRYGADPTRRIAMLGDGTGFKIELIEGTDAAPPGASFAHVAWRVDDVDAAFDALCAEGYEAVVAPREIEAARARTALLRDPMGLSVQIITYEADSPDL